MAAAVAAAVLAGLGALAAPPGTSAAQRAAADHPTSVSTPFRIDQTRIGRAPLGKPAAYYRAAYSEGAAPRRVLDDDGFERLVFDDWHVAVIFEPGRDVAVGVVSWAARSTTRERLGACSRLAAVRKAYGTRLVRVAKGEDIEAWRLGKLVFVAGSDGFVRSVGLFAPKVSIGPALSAPACGAISVG